MNNAIIEKANGNNIATVNGDGYVALPYKSIGYPYTVMMDIKLDSNTSENTEIFSGDDGVMYANIDGTGKIGYSRSGYNFTFDYELPKDTWVNLALTCDQKNTTLYINGKAITTGINMGTAINNRKDSSTFVLPVEKILNNAKGSVDNIKIYNKTFSATEISDELGYIQLENLALNKNATASSVNPLTPNLTPNLAVDGDNTKVTTNRWSSKRATGAGTNEGDTEYGTVEQDLTVDLGANYKVDKVFISWEGAYATKYTIQGSLDGVNFFDIKDITNGTGGEITHKDLGDVETRYVRIACHDAKNRNWGYSIYELEVYQSTNEGLRALVKEGQAELAKFDAGNKNGNIAKDDYEVFEQKFEDYLALADGTEISTEEIGKLLKEVTAIINSIEDSVIYSKNELNELYQKVSLYQEKDFTKDSFVDFNTKLTAIKGLIDNADDYIKVNEAMGQLQTLDSSLVKLDRSKLKTAIESYDNFQETDYTTSSWQTMKTIVDAAKLVHENVSLNQVDVDNAIAALNEINLEKRGNTKELAKLLKEYDEADYTISTWAEFAGVYQAANAMVVDNSDVNQEQVDAMVALVREAAMKLLELGNSKDLEKVINKITEAIKDLDQANYDQDSWNKLQTMIKAAKELLDSKDVSQAELDAMLDSLNQVYDALKPIEVKPGEETETPTNKPVTDTSDKSVKTGDDVNLFGYAGLLGIALMGLICRKKFD
ncbi:MAG: discoidin domain-containing protein [Thomasclavelia ramosa]